MGRRKEKSQEKHVKCYCLLKAGHLARSKGKTQMFVAPCLGKVVSSGTRRLLSTGCWKQNPRKAACLIAHFMSPNRRREEGGHADPDVSRSSPPDAI